VASFPWPDYWMPLPTTGSGPPVLGRRSTSALSAVSAPARDRWTIIQPSDSALPVLERHWACPDTSPARLAPLRADGNRDETVTRPRATTAAIADRLALPDRIPTTPPLTVTLTTLDAVPQTVTRLCIGCGKPLERKRPQAKAHGVACRQRAYRRRKKEAEQTQGHKENRRGSTPQRGGLARTAIGSAPA
jgi:hypothetical protein